MDNWITAVMEWAKVGLLATFGGAASYVYLAVTKQRQFVWWAFLANLFIAFFVGKVFGEFIPATNPNRSGYLMLLGFAAYPVLGVLEAKVVAYLQARTDLPGKQE